MPEPRIITPDEMDRHVAERASGPRRSGRAGELHSLDDLPKAFRGRVVERDAAIEARLAASR